MATRKKAGVLKLNDVLMDDIKTIQQEVATRLEKLQEEVETAQTNLNAQAGQQISQIITTFLKVHEKNPGDYQFDIETGEFKLKELEAV